jgi:hypothetical protein
VVCEAHAFFGHFVDVGGFYIFLAEAAEMGVAEVVGHYVDNVGFGCGLSGAGGHRAPGKAIPKLRLRLPPGETERCESCQLYEISSFHDLLLIRVFRVCNKLHTLHNFVFASPAPYSRRFTMQLSFLSLLIISYSGVVMKWFVLSQVGRIGRI